MKKILLFSAITLLYSAIYAQKLIPYRNDDKWGYISDNDVIKIEPQFDTVHFIIENRCVVMLNQRYGIIDAEGNMIAEPKYNKITNYKNGQAFLRKKRKLFICDTIGNITKVDAKDKDLYRKANDKLNENIKTEKKYNTVKIQSEIKLPDNIIIPEEYGKYSFIDKNHIIVEKNNKWGIITYQNDIVAFIDYDSIAYLGNYYFKVLENKKWALAKFEYELETEYKYDDIRLSCWRNDDEPWFYVKQENMIGALDKKGNKIIPAKYDILNDEVYSVDNIDLIVSDCSGGIVFHKDGLCGYMNSAGKVIIQPKYLKIKMLDNILYLVVQTCDEKWGYIDLNGTEFFE